MFGNLFRFLGRHIVTEVPAEIDACMDCNVPQCSGERFDACPNRLATLAARKAAEAKGTAGDEPTRRR